MQSTATDFVSALIVARDVRLSGDDTRRYSRDVERGRLVRVRRGVYLPTQLWAGMNRTQRGLARMWAYHLTAERPPVFSHESAARLHGLPLLPGVDERLSVAVPLDAAPKADRDLRRRPLGVAPEEVIVVHGLQATSPARTVVDLSVALVFSSAVVVADAALGGGTVSADDLEQSAQNAAIQRVSRKARRVLDFADPRSGSAGESLSRAVIHESGFPAPVLQQTFHDTKGLIGIVDFWWPEHRLIGEFDGRVKYQAGRFEGTPEERLWNEKLREDRLRAQRTSVARWIWSDALAPSLLVYELSRHGLPSSKHRLADRTPR